MARIAYKEWKERKDEEEKLRRKRERIDRREQMIAQGVYQSNRDALGNLRRQNAMRENGGEVMLAYGMNKNLKKLRDRPKSAKPMRKKTKKQDQLIV
jgi:hypothetical protein